MAPKTLNQNELHQKELAYLVETHGPFDPAATTGLALSGGGIRSAAFALGVVQALCRYGIFQRLHYLSTVSGGGYLGSCLTWIANVLAPPDPADPATPCQKIGHRGEGARTGATANQLIDYLRQHGRYLTPPGFDGASLAAVVLRSMLLGFVVYFPPLAFAMGCLRETARWLAGLCPTTAGVPAAVDATFTSMFLVLAGLAGALFGLCSLLHAIARRFPILPGLYQGRCQSQRFLGWALKIVIICLALASLPWVLAKLRLVTASVSVSFATLASGATALATALRQARRPDSGLGRILESVAAPLAALVLVYALLAGAFLVAGHLPLLPHLLLAAVAAWVIGHWADLNTVSLHRMYRDRLMETFLPEPAAVAKNQWQPARTANTTTLAALRRTQKDGVRTPLHLINTNLILVDSPCPKYRGRGGDNFILSPVACGSDATGWVDAETFNDGTMTLATAMAVSGAAVNPHSGCLGRGPTRNQLVSLLMSFFNFRLGYWARNPKSHRRPCRPTCWNPGLVMGLMGRGFHEERRFIQLSDGGHFENLGVYELIRRRVRTIVVADAGADPQFNFADLANLVEKVRVDFGVEITFPPDKAPVADLVPGSGAHKSLYRDKYRLARRGYAVGLIHYPATAMDKAATGTIYYLKTTLTGGLPEDLYAYKSANPSFPDQPTSDQFFDETQFEAYRELGYRLAKTMVLETNLAAAG